MPRLAPMPFGKVTFYIESAHDTQSQSMKDGGIL